VTTKKGLEGPGITGKKRKKKRRVKRSHSPQSRCGGEKGQFFCLCVGPPMPSYGRKKREGGEGSSIKGGKWRSPCAESRSGKEKVGKSITARSRKGEGRRSPVKLES